MSRLRRWVLSDRFFLISCRVHRPRRNLSESEISCLTGVVRERRRVHRFLVTAWASLHDYRRAVLGPPFPLTISEVMESIKVSSTRLIDRARGERGVLMQGRYFDRALRTVMDYNERVECIHLNPVTAGLVKKPEEWKWSSVHDYTGSLSLPVGKSSPIPADRILLPGDLRARI